MVFENPHDDLKTLRTSLLVNKLCFKATVPLMSPHPSQVFLDTIGSEVTLAKLSTVTKEAGPPMLTPAWMETEELQLEVKRQCQKRREHRTDSGRSREFFEGVQRVRNSGVQM
ncbi:hypothetical protein MVEG_04680 [Podila verticillata NRRL 6337]|nr:hypothetical protein MVEG_04680 [Podila verticillata NRRL 6337]